jgi:hypothetical protein
MIDFKRLWWRWVICVAAAMGVVYAAGGSLGPVMPAMLGVLATLSALLWAELTEPF